MYVSGYKKIDSERKPIHAFIIYFADTPIGYIQYFNAYDFPRDGCQLNSLPKSLAAIDLFIGDENYLGKGIGAKSLALLKRYEIPNFPDRWEAEDFDVVKIAQDNYLCIDSG